MKQILKYILSQVMENLHFAEGKHNISITLSSAVIVFAASQFSLYTRLGSVFASCAIVSCAASLFCSFSAMSSRKIRWFHAFKRADKANNLIYFQDISSFDEETYLKKIQTDYSLPKQYKPDGFDFDLARQIIATSKVAKIKFRLFNAALSFLALSICFVVTSIVVSQVLK